MDHLDRIRAVSSRLGHQERSGTVLMRMRHQATGPVHVPANQHRSYAPRRTMPADATPASHQMLYSRHPARDQRCTVQRPLSTPLWQRPQMAHLSPRVVLEPQMRRRRRSGDPGQRCTSQ